MRPYRFFTLALVSVLSINVKAQELDFSDILRASAEDARLYFRSYINPLMKGAGYGLTNGWYNTAKPHRLLGIDVTADVNFAIVPDKDLRFQFQGFNTLSIESGSDQLPTIVGPESETSLLFSTTAEVTYDDPDPSSPTFGQEVTSEEVLKGDFSAPDGSDLKDKFGAAFVPVPMVQVGVGLIKNTELKLRYLPSVKSDDFEFKFFGVGVMHDFKQWTPGISHLPFDMSGFIGFTRLKAETRFAGLNVAGSEQVAGYNVKSLTLQVVASKELWILTVFGGLGYNITNSNLKMKGLYVIDGETDLTLQDGTVETVEANLELLDPIDQNFKSTGPRVTAGLRIKLLVITLHAAYTIQEYNTFTVGLGVSVR